MHNSYPQELSTGLWTNQHPASTCTYSVTIDSRVYAEAYKPRKFWMIPKQNDYLYSFKVLMIKKIKRKSFFVFIAAVVIGAVLGSSTAQASTNPSIELYKLYAHMQLGNDAQYWCLVQLWHKESKWLPTANNKQSSAYGIPQLLKMTETNPYKQIELGLKYIKHRHKTPCLALAHHKKGWY